MKKMLVSLLFCLSCLPVSWAQDGKMQLFEEFKDALIIANNGNQYIVAVNFDYSIGEFVFIDKSDRDLVKLFADPATIRHIKIGERFFLPTADLGSPVEVISVEPHFRIHHKGVFKDAPKSTSYGGTTQTASVDTYTGNFKGGGLISAERMKNKILERTENEYEIKVGKRTRTFSDKRGFIRLFPKDKRAGLEAFIDDRNIDFQSLGQVFQLYKYAIGQP